MTPGVLYHRLEFRDVEAEHFKEVLDRANLEHTIIAGKHGCAEIEQLHSPAFSLDLGRYAFPVVARGQFAPGSICIGIAQGERVPTWINGSSTGRGDLQLYCEGAEIFYRAGSAAHWAGLTVTRERLQAEARKRLGRELPLSSPGVMKHLHIDSRAFDRLMGLIRSLRPRSLGISPSRDAEAISELVLGAYVEAIAAADPSSANAIQQRVAHRYEVVRRADAAMRRLIGTAYSSTQFCKGLGMTERNLELYFREALGLVPRPGFNVFPCTMRARCCGRRRQAEAESQKWRSPVASIISGVSPKPIGSCSARGPLKPFHLASSQLHRGKSAGSPRVAKNASASTKWPCLTLSSTICGHCC